MKFEHVLQIYWTKGFFFGGNLFYTNQTLNSLLLYTPGLSKHFKKKLSQRFEFTILLQKPTLLLPEYDRTTHRNTIKPLNVILSQIHTVNNVYKDLQRLLIMRLYLIKSYRGRCHAIGKPVKGQRTWSNGWNSYNVNKVLRYFIIETKRKSHTKQVEEKINYKVVKKKYPTKKKIQPDKQVKITSKWF